MKIKVISSIIIVMLTIIFVGCDDVESPEIRKFPESAINVRLVNTSYDELNETITGVYYEFLTFLFSSNKQSNGENYNIFNYLLSVESYNNGDSLYFDIDTTGYPNFNTIANKINSTFNEKNINIIRTDNYGDDMFFYADDSEGDYNFYYSKGDVLLESWTPISDVTKFNTSSNDVDILILNNGIMYSSDINGQYDIFTSEMPTNTNMVDWIESDNIPTIEPFDIINSSADERCPHISGNYIYFSSNRDGGFGGYDIYYSHYKDGEWSVPINCGENVNSEQDELNPFAVFYSNYKNDLLFFSSNRTGGKGGFDIYAVGIPKIID